MSLIKTHVDPNLQLAKNKSDFISLLEYSRKIDSFMYLMNFTNPNITHAINKLSRFMSNPSNDH